MFVRVAAYGIAACLVVMPAISNGETNALGETQAPSVAASIVTPLEQTDDQVVVSEQEQTQQQPQDDSQAQTKIAALDPAEPPATSPPVAAPALPTPAMGEPFGLTVMPVTGGALLTKWNGVEAGIRADSEIFARCRTNAQLCPPAARSFLAIVAQGRARTGRARLGIINRAINMAIIPTSDFAQWGVIDRWSPPLETFTTGRGDCEDYAIAKYVALTEAGVAAEDVRLVVVRNLAANEDHAVVAARLDGNWIILDNRWLTLIEDSEMAQAVPLFVLDRTGVFAFMPTVAPDVQRAAAPHQGIASAPGSLPLP